MKRRSADDENMADERGHSTRKRARSQKVDVEGRPRKRHSIMVLTDKSFQDDAANLEKSTPTKSRRDRYSSNGQSTARAGKLIEEDIEEDATHPERPEEDDEIDIEMSTPSKRGRGRPKTNGKHLETTEKTLTPKKPLKGNASFSTPKTNGKAQVNDTLLDLPDADRSARRKSARTIIERTIADTISEDDEDEDLARHIYESGEDEDAAEDESEGHDDLQDPESVSETPSKKARGRPKGSKYRKRSPTPPQDLPPHELYFFQNRGGSTKTSNNNLSSLKLLDHEEYFGLLREYKDPHAEDMEFLQELHSRSFNQWQFELSQDFNICVYGWGSKRKLLTSFAEHVYKSKTDHDSNKIVVVNGYVHNTSIRDILNTLAGAVSDHPQKLGSQVTEMFETLCAILEADKAKHMTLIIHSIDGSPLRRSMVQTILARLASHPQIHLIASADHPSFPLLWDSSLRSTYNFLFHDCTTFQPYAVEVDVINEVHELLGRSGRRVGGKEGVAFVLKSLNQNSRKLFQLLVAEQLAAMDEGAGFGGGDEQNGDNDDMNDDHRRGIPNKRNEQGVEYRLLYQKAVEDFICGDEVTFRTLLKEYASNILPSHRLHWRDFLLTHVFRFHDHQMIHSRKDAMGTEMLSVPFRKEELETILEDLMA
jgi:origin recognition complex subunit 2